MTNENKITLAPPILKFTLGTLICGVLSYFTLENLAAFPPLMIIFVPVALGLFFFIKSLVMSPFNFLVLDEQGFTVKAIKAYRWKPRKEYFWRDVTHFMPRYPGHGGKKNSLRVHFENTPEPRSEGYGPAEFKIPYNYGMGAEKLAELMNMWRDKYKHHS